MSAAPKAFGGRSARFPDRSVFNATSPGLGPVTVVSQPPAARPDIRIVTLANDSHLSERGDSRQDPTTSGHQI